MSGRCRYLSDIAIKWNYKPIGVRGECGREGEASSTVIPIILRTSFRALGMWVLYLGLNDVIDFKSVHLWQPKKIKRWDSLPSLSTILIHWRIGTVGLDCGCYVSRGSAFFCKKIFCCLAVNYKTMTAILSLGYMCQQEVRKILFYVFPDAGRKAVEMSRKRSFVLLFLWLEEWSVCLKYWKSPYLILYLMHENT